MSTNSNPRTKIHNMVSSMDASGIQAAVEAIAKLYREPLPSTRTGSLYNAFSYPTKISPEAIAVYIATHTQPGATVLDAFGGSGTTGLAALLCDKPTPEMQRLAESLEAKPKWGPRNVQLFEIGTLGSFISQTMCHPPDPDEFAAAAEELCLQAEEKLGWLMSIKDVNGKLGTLRHAIWSEVLVCPQCSAETSLWDASVKTQPLVIADSFTCKGCHEQVSVGSCERATETVLDIFGREQHTRKRVLARVHGRCGTNKWQRPPSDEDLELLNLIAKEPPPKLAPDADIEWGELRRTGYHFGIDKLHHFYTKRNFIVMATMMELVSGFSESVREALRLLVLSYNASHSTLMSRVVRKKGQNDFVLTGSQSGVLYISGLPVEKNIIEGVRRKSKSFISSFRLLYGSRSRVTINNTSSEAMPLKSGSVDYIFTDPPFGDYIPYAELNQINELWLGRSTDRSREVIVSPSQAKGVSEYAFMMGLVFKEMARVLKPDGVATVVFHSAHSKIWRALIQAYSAAGFTVEATSVLDKIQASFKQIVSNVAVKGDPLLLLSKRPSELISFKSGAKIAAEVIHDASEDLRLDPQRLYSLFVGRCLEQGNVVDIDAKAFYALVNTESLYS